ncbi:FGFR1 oncogene partner isoform X3 [Sander lucioperca]|uniref:FGFR1 oncogene partner isoform X3 n=1 Tax=Sander lucioperca TaxID=283035 RepID=UPI0016537ED7|nr:FGFR1 oncogene partner isoform X3 [Sander lucioperca]
MSATEDDTELRDLLIQNLENNGVLNKLKAEMRAAVFLAMEEQDRLENKTPLINENLKKCLNTKDGRLVVGLIVDFLQVFNLDFSLAVFQPEINSLNSVDSRDLVCRDLGLSESEVNRNSPLLLELVRRGRHNVTEGDKSRDILKVVQDEEKISSPPVSKIPRYKGGHSHTAAKEPEGDSSLGKADFQPTGFRLSTASDRKRDLDQDQDLDLDLEVEVEDDPEEGDSFFDDPLPKPQKTYGCVDPLREECLAGPVVSPLRRGKSLSDLSVQAADSEEEPDDHSQTSELRKGEASGARVSPAGSLSETQRPRGGSSTSEKSHSRNSHSLKAPSARERGFRDSKAPNDKTGSLHLDDDVEYDDDFNSHRSDLSRSEVSIGEEIEEVSIEGPDNSDKFDDITQDLSVSQLSQSHGADYMEEVA